MASTINDGDFQKNPDTNQKSKVVVALLPFFQDKLLLQLRDQKEGIVFPGHWGFFSGEVEKDEKPLTAAKRELFEELGYSSKNIKKLGIKKIPDHHTLSHVYFFPLRVPLEKLLLQEGMDLGLFSAQEINSLRLYSSKLRQWFPVVDTPMFKETIRELFARIKNP